MKGAIRDGGECAVCLSVSHSVCLWESHLQTLSSVTQTPGYQDHPLNCISFIVVYHCVHHFVMMNAALARYSLSPAELIFTMFSWLVWISCTEVPCWTRRDKQHRGQPNVHTYRYTALCTCMQRKNFPLIFAFSLSITTLKNLSKKNKWLWSVNRIYLVSFKNHH